MSQLPQIDHIYIVHHPMAARRKAALDQWMAHMDFPPGYAEYRSHFVAESLDEKEVARYFNPDKAEHLRRAQAVSPESGHLLHFPLNRREIATGMEHVELLRDAQKRGFDRILVLEDDALFPPDFKERFEEAMRNAPEDADVLSLGEGCGLHIHKPPYNIPIVPEKKWYENPKHHGRCTDSYVIGRKAIETVLPMLAPFSLPIDWEMNYQFALHKSSVYWLEPSLVLQGSFCGAYPSLTQRV